MRIDQLPFASSVTNGNTLPVNVSGTTEQVTIGNLVNSIRDDVYGAPLTAATAAAMTDQTKIYVYTGTTGGGFTNGHWYYYNGTAWTDGGVYNSAAVQTDTTLSLSGVPADAKAVGDAISATNANVNANATAIEENAGNIATNTTNISNLTTRVSADEAAIAQTFSASTAYAAGAYVWYNGNLYRFTAAHAAGAWTGTDAAQVPLAGDVADLKSALDYISDHVEKTEEETIGGILAQWTSGAFGASGYVNTNKWFKAIKLEKGVYEITVPSNYRYQVYKYISDSSGELYISATSSNGLYDIDADFVVSAGRNDAADLSNNDLTAIRNGVKITKKDGTIKSAISDSQGNFIPSAELKSVLDFVADKSGTTSEIVLGTVSAQWTLGIYSSEGYVSSNKWLKSKTLQQGIYDVSVPSGYRYTIYKYVSDTSGTQIIAATSSNGLYDIDGSFIVSIGRNDASDLSQNDINTITFGMEITRKDASMLVSLDDVTAQAQNFIDYAAPVIADFTGEELLNITWADGAYNDSGYINSNAWLRSQKLSKGKYDITIPSGYRYMIYKYVSDTSGTQIVAATTTSGSYDLADDFIISVSKELGGVLSYDEAMELKRYTVVIQRHTDKLPIQTENTQVDIWNATVTFPIGEGELTHMTAYGNGVYKAYNDADGVSRIRIILNTAFSPVGINKFIAKVYIPDSTKCQSLTLSPIGTSASIQHSGTLKNGWNDVVFYPFTADVSTWGNVTEIRITAGGTAGIEWYLAELTYVKNDVAWMLFIEDGGYNTFFENGYPDLKGIGIPTTLAYDCGTSGDWQIPITDVIDLYDEGYLEMSYHAWNPHTPTESMSASEIRAETAKCLRMLSENNMLPEHVWRAAHTQNLATNGLAQKGMVEALATWTGSGTPFNVFPFMNKWDVKRSVLQGKTTSELDFIFDVLQKTRCGAVMYTHGISNDSAFDVTPTIWDYFVGKLTTAVNAGWLKGTTYNELANGVME